MGGTILNAIAVLIGSVLGMLIGDRLPQRMRETVVFGLGLVTLTVGVSNAQASGNIVIPLLSIAIGGIVGEMLRVDVALDRIGGWLQSRFGGGEETPPPNPSPSVNATSAVETTPHKASAPSQPHTAKSPSPLEGEGLITARQRFITGFVTASLVFCVGPLTILGSIQDGMGLAAGYQQLIIKSVLDGFAALAFAASFGLGVVFTVLTVLVVQGSLALIGSVAGQFMTPAMVAEMTATGGMILIGLSIILMDIKRPRVANFLPALLIAPLLVAVATALGINVYPFT